MDKIKLIIADDHQLFCEGLKLLLTTTAEFEVIGEFTDNNQLLKQLPSLSQAQLLLLDFHMPGVDTPGVLKKLKHTYPHIKLVILTATTSALVLKQLLDLQIEGVLLKDCSGTELLQALRDIMAGDKVVSSQVRQMLATDLFHLTKREFQLLHLIYQGMEKAQIVQTLCLSPRTVEKHRENIMSKMEVKNVVQLVNKVNRLKLFEAFNHYQ